jgi:hypothetical protein
MEMLTTPPARTAGEKAEREKHETKLKKSIEKTRVKEQVRS